MPLGRRISGRLLVVLSIVVSTLAGCANAEDVAPPPVSAVPPPQAPQASEPQSPTTVIDTSAATEGPAPPKTEIFNGSDTFTRPSAQHRSAASAGPDGVALDFADADIKDVVRTIFGDILKVPYSIDPQIQGKVTLKTSEPLAKKDVIAALETTLKVNGAAIVFANNVYNVVPVAEAQRRVSGFQMPSSGAREPGYGIEIVPLRYVAVAEMQKILQPVAPQGGVMGSDATRNLLFIAGTGQERATMLDTINMFDVDYLKGMSFALVRPEHVEAATLASELKNVFAKTNGPISSLIDFIPLTRINTLLIVSPRAAYLNQATRWVDRLDVVPQKSGRRIYLYRLQNAKAQDVGQALAAVFGQAQTNFGQSSGSGAEPDTSSSTPYSGPMGGQGGSGPQGNGFSPASLSQGSGETSPSSAGPAPAIASSEGMQVVPDVSNNALIVRADAAEYAMLEKFLREIDVTPDQVVIEATIAEVSLNDKLKYGVEWFFRSGDSSFNFSQSGAVSTHFPGLAYSYIVPNVQVALSALGSLTDISVISSPQIFTLNNKPALLQVGDQVPVITQTAVGITQNTTAPTIVNSVQFRDTGIVLKVTPRIAKSGMVFVDVSQEVSDAVPTTTSGIDSPTIQQRKLATTVAVQDGDTIALGGLIRRSETKSDSGIPVLKDVPVLGHLFSSTDNSGLRTELLIFLKPKIIRNAQAAREMTDELRESLSRLKHFMTPEPTAHQ